jgi:hypothetical protein
MIVVDCVQGSMEWAEARRGIATASRFGDLLTPKRLEFSESGARTYACELLAERFVSPHYWIQDDYASGPMKHGTLREQEARDYFAFQVGMDVEQVGFVMTDDKRFGASPDSFVGGDAGLELKCPLHKTQVSYLLDPGILINQYKAQCHGCMLVTKRDTWHLMSYAVGLPPVMHTFTVDDYTKRLAEALEQFSELFNKLAAEIEAMSDPVYRAQESYF